MVGMGGQAGIAHPFHLGMALQELRHGLSVRAVPLHPELQGDQPADSQPRIEGLHCPARVDGGRSQAVPAVLGRARDAADQVLAAIPEPKPYAASVPSRSAMTRSKASTVGLPYPRPYT